METIIKFEHEYNKLGIVGSPVEHSLSPLIQNFMIQELDLPFYYLSYDIAKDKFSDFLVAAKLLNITGCNVTMPHKLNAFATVDKVIGNAKTARTVNTITLKNNRWEGYNTDGAGFNLSLEERGIYFENKKVLLIGAGGAARILVITALEKKAKSISVISRNIEQGIEILKGHDNCNAFKWTSNNLNQLAAENDIIINCTPLGMKGITENFSDFEFLNTSEKVICDLIYNPTETLLLQKAKQKKHNIINGLGMLLYQAMFSLEIFTGDTFDKVNMRKKLASNFKFN